MAPPIHLPHAALNDAAFALLEQYAQGKISDMVALSKIDVELAITKIHFKPEEWLDLIKIILMNPTEGLDSIKAAQQLMQVKVVPLLEDAAAWQLVLWWAGDDSLSFNSFLQEMQDTFKERYKFDDWKTIFDQVFEASCEGTAVKVVRAAMTENGVLNPPSVADLSSQASSSDNVLHTLPSTRASSSQTCKVSHRSNGSLLPAKRSRLDKSIAQFLDVSMQEDDKDEDGNEDIDNLAIGVDCHSRVTEVGLLGQATFNQHLQDLACHYECEGSVTRSNA
ncbi:hypothetical protein EDD16DRAFT_1709683 [Pisolithus croceorrhizus]|nr:hypothetical protein EDD16DRAFT_1709683 [Pisolithus croceorrhizus]